MMRFFLGAAVLAVSGAVSANSLDGKAIFCTSLKPSYDVPFGFEFVAGKVTQYSIGYREGGVEAFVKENSWLSPDPTPYIETVDFVYWDDRTKWLNRKTLVLESRYGNTGEVYSTMKCEVSLSAAAMKNAMEMAKQKKQKEIDEKMKDNKI